jgi:cyclophilin family peptidyl-prolyl cis-trans isomerase/HEAT repeat protein
MRVPSWARLTAFVLLLGGTGCPKSATTTSPSSKLPAEDPQIEKLARVLRAADRRIVDDDLRALLKDQDPVVRARAAETLGQIGDATSLPDVEKAVADATPEVRASAAFALGIIGEASADETLRPLATDPSPRVRAAAAEALGRLHVPGSAPAVLTLLDDEHPEVRVAAALGAWKFADAKPFLEALIKALSSADADVRASCAYALARLASAAIPPAASGAAVGHLSEEDTVRAGDALAERVGDPESEVRMQVARGLAWPKSAPHLAVVGALTKDKSPGVRVNAVRSLGYPGFAIDPYLDHAVVDRDQCVARAAIETVGKIGGSTALETLTKLLATEQKGWLLEATLTGIARVDPSQLPGLVVGLLKNPNPVMRAAVATLIAGQKDPGAMAAATTMLGDPAPRVVVAAIPIVADQEGPLADLLTGQFEAPDPVVRATVAEAVGGRFTTPRSSVEPREDLFGQLELIWGAAGNDKIPDAKLAVVDAVAKAGKDERTKGVLERALKDPDVVVRRRAAARFKDVYGEDRSHDVGPAADRPLADYVRIVRWARAPHGAIILMQRPGSQTARFDVVLDGDAAPMAAWNFYELASKHFFDGLTLHRVVPNFVVQDGDPRGDGFGGPGYSIRDEFNPLRFTAGVLGMASDGKDSAGSQWFITVSMQPHLDGRYTSFGHVAKGLREVVEQMRPGDTVLSVQVVDGVPAAAQPSN